MELKLELDDQEMADIGGWVNYYADRPNEAPSKLVLSNRTRARFNQVANQFYAHWGLPKPPPVIVPPPSTGAPWDWPVAILSPLWGAELRTTLSTRVITAIPIDTQASGQIYLSCAEFGTAPCTRQVCFSTKAGDFARRISDIGSGNTASMDTTVEQRERVYFNIRFWSPDRNMPSTDAESAGVVIGGNWPHES